MTPTRNLPAHSFGRRRFLLAGAATAGLLATSCSSTANTKKPVSANQTLVVAQTADITTLDPLQQAQTTTRTVLVHLYNPLVETSADDPRKLTPVLAKRWRRVNDRTYRFTLDTDARFSDGSVFGAKDVKYTFDYMLGRLPDGRPAVQAKYFPDIEDVTVIDEANVDVSTKAPDPLLPARMTRLMIVKRGSVDDDPKALATAANGTGPYELVKWTRNQQVVVKAKDNYFRAPAKIKNVAFRVMTEDSTRVAGLQSGQVHLVAGLPVDNIAEVRSRGVAEVRSLPGDRVFQVWLNTLTPGPLQNTKVRQALNHAIDVNAIVEKLMSGYATRTATVAPDYFSDVDPSVKPYTYDQQKAKALLAEAGYADGFTMELMVPRDRYPYSSEIAQTVVQSLGQVGVKVELQSVDFGAFVTAVESRKIPDAFMAGLEEVLFSPIDFMQTTVADGGGFSWYKNEEVDKLLTKAAQTLDDDKRTELVTQIQHLLLADPPFIFMFVYTPIYGVSKKVDWQPRKDEIVNVYGASWQSSGD